jgi:hypothetical protein
VPEHRLTAKQFGRALRRRLQADVRLFERAALDTVMWGLQRAVALTNERGLVDQREYKDSWSYRRISGGAELGNSAPHAPVIEHGRRPNRPGPPLAPILAWVIRNRGKLGLKLGRRRRNAAGEMAFKDEDQAAAESGAWAIRWKIHKRGSKPHGVLRQVHDEMKPHLRRAAIAALERKW